MSTYQNALYHNWDDITFRRQWVQNPSGTLPAEKNTVPLAVYDEIHKAKGWKRSLKGVYDTLESPADILVTGSARLNVYRRNSDSLMGRYYHFRLHPFTAGELLDGTRIPLPEDVIKKLKNPPGKTNPSARSIFEDMMAYGPFPEPLLSQNSRKTRLWRRTRIERVIREDLRDLSRIQELSQVEMLAALLPERVGAPLSISTFQPILETSHHTLKRWLAGLKELYLIYELKPFTGNVSRSLKKEGKFYMWDFGEVPDAGARLENLVGSHLLKACHCWTDMGEGTFDLFYLRNKEKQEIDFLIVRDGTPWLPVEVKTGDTTPSPNWKKFLRQIPCKTAVQVCRKPGVWNLHRADGKTLIVSSADPFLSCLP